MRAFHETAMRSKRRIGLLLALPLGATLDRVTLQRRLDDIGTR
jgi:hypothetical protein